MELLGNDEGVGLEAMTSSAKLGGELSEAGQPRPSQSVLASSLKRTYTTSERCCPETGTEAEPTTEDLALDVSS